MPRKDFQNHLGEAEAGALPTNITSLKTGDDDGTFTFVFQYADVFKMHIQVQVSDISDYPKAHSFFIYTDSENVPSKVSSALESFSIVSEITISQIIMEIADKLTSVMNAINVDSGMELIDGDDGHEAEQDFEDADDLDDGFCPLEGDEMDDSDFSSTSTNFNHAKGKSSFTSQLGIDDRARLRDKIRKDLQEVKNAGFRVAHHGDLCSPGEQCYLMISVRIAKLGIPEDALQAWHLQQSEYIMLLIRYRHGYRPLHTLKGSGNTGHDIAMHILITKQYKLSSLEILETITTIKAAGDKNAEAEDVNDKGKNVRSLFIGSALDELLNTRLVMLIQYRLNLHANWTGAMSFYNDYQGAFVPTSADLNAYQEQVDEGHMDGLANIVLADHIIENPSDSAKTLSFPLIAMQFSLRHIVRCTEFCLVCYDRTKDEFEALKPYVCSKPLCLYQYMSMGLGPGIEFEVLSQKYVVDLLISFCYNSAASFRLKNTPIGLGMMVPNPKLLPGMTKPTEQVRREYEAERVGSTSQQDLGLASTTNTLSMIFTGTWSRNLKELRITEHQQLAPTKCAIKTGDWVCFWGSNGALYHCKVVDASHGVYQYQHLISSKAEKSSANLSKSTTKTKNVVGKEDKNSQESEDMEAAKPKNVSITTYYKTYDDLDAIEKQSAICAMLDTLPSVTEMAEYLKNAPRSKALLINWNEKIIPSALAMLRWIIASNRSCIVYTGDKSNKERIHGMPGYLQFRFASGAPDKESRFLKEVQTTAARLNTKQPTLFAWHGSPANNWHSIIREGLNFDKVVHGRAFGNGVYHAMDANTSTGYSNNWQIKQESIGRYRWPSSILDVEIVLSLNEIVNAPNEFQSKLPYLVVQKTDWIQTRYLFVKCKKFTIPEDEQEIPTSILEQDSGYTPIDTVHKHIIIPSCAISKSRRDALEDVQNGQSYNNSGKRKSITNIDLTYDDSDGSDAEDIALYSHQVVPTDVTDFRPGSLDWSKLPMLAAPSYATPSSSKALRREIKAMLKEQDETPLHELGWYFDPEYIDNPYQWLVELHSFDKDLPLAKDMESQKISSIVLEVRFGPNFNFSPPFIRVVKPRFLPFLHGGGGHVTAGGALCMQLLTSDGWNPSSTMSAVLLQVRMAITSIDPNPARLEQPGRKNEYGVGEAVDAYIRACRAHGWKVPDDFQQLSAIPTASSSGSQGRGPSGKKTDVLTGDDAAAVLTPAVTPSLTPVPASKKMRRE